MNRSRSSNGRTARHWLSQLLDDAAFPALVLALAVSQLKVGHHKKDALRELGLKSDEAQVGNGFGEGADKYGERAAMESPRFKEKTGPEKEFTHNQ